MLLISMEIAAGLSLCGEAALTIRYTMNWTAWSLMKTLQLTVRLKECSVKNLIYQLIKKKLFCKQPHTT